MRLINLCIIFLMIQVGIPEMYGADAKKAIVHGKVENASGKDVVFVEYGMPFNFDPNNKVNIGKDGTFSVELELDNPQYYYISYQRRNAMMFLAPGDEITVSFDARKMEQTLTFEGNNSEMSTYVFERQKMEQPIARTVKSMYAKEWDEYKGFLDKNRTQLQEHLDNFKKGKKIKKGTLADFVKLEQANIDGIWSMYYAQYPSHHAHYAKKNPAEIWISYDLAAINQYLTDDPSLLASKAYRDFLNQYLFSQCDYDFVKEQAKIQSRSEFVAKVYEKIDDKIELDWVKDYLRARVIFEQVNKYGLAEMVGAVEDFRGRKKMPEPYQTAVEKAWNKWESIKPGAPAPDFVGKDIDGNEIRLSDFKGKWVYIDVWAIWCGPCRREIPHLKKAEKTLHGKDVVFMSVSTDDSFSKWKDFVVKEELSGVQINVPGGWSSDICKKYNISSIPRFMLIDREGKIVDVQTMRPSQGITALLQKKLMEE